MERQLHPGIGRSILHLARRAKVAVLVPAVRVVVVVPPAARRDALLQLLDAEAAFLFLPFLAWFRFLLRLVLAWFHGGTSFQAVCGRIVAVIPRRADRTPGRCRAGEDLARLLDLIGRLASATT